MLRGVCSGIFAALLLLEFTGGFTLGMLGEGFEGQDGWSGALDWAECKLFYREPDGDRALRAYHTGDIRLEPLAA